MGGRQWKRKAEASVGGRQWKRKAKASVGNSGRGRQRKDEAEGGLREIQSLRGTWQVTAAIKEGGRGSLAKHCM